MLWVVIGVVGRIRLCCCCRDVHVRGILALSKSTVLCVKPLPSILSCPPCRYEHSCSSLRLLRLFVCTIVLLCKTVTYLSLKIVTTVLGAIATSHMLKGRSASLKEEQREVAHDTSIVHSVASLTKR